MPDVDIAVSNWSDVLLKKAYQFYANTNFCDLTLEFSDRVQMKVHRLILNTCTNFFQKIEDQYQQSDGTVASNIIVMLPAEISFHSLQPIITFLYTGKLKFLHNDFEEVYSTAKLMKMDAIIQILEHQQREFTKTGVLSNSFSLTNNRNGGRKRKSAAAAAAAVTRDAAAGNGVYDLESNAAPLPKRMTGSKSHSLPLYRGKTLPPKPCRLDVPNTLIDYPFSDIKCEDIILKKPTHSDIFDKTKQSKVTVEKIGLTHNEIMKKIEKVNESLQKDSFLEDDEIVTINDLGNDHENDDDEDEDVIRPQNGNANMDAEINNNAEKEVGNTTNRSVNFTEIREFAQELKLRNQQLIASEKRKSQERKKPETVVPTATAMEVEKENGELLNESKPIIRSLPVLDSFDASDLSAENCSVDAEREKREKEVPEKQQPQQEQNNGDSKNKTISEDSVVGEPMLTSAADSETKTSADVQETERAEILIAAVEKLQQLPKSSKKAVVAAVATLAAASVATESVVSIAPVVSKTKTVTKMAKTNVKPEVASTTATETKKAAAEPTAPKSPPAVKSKVDVRSTRRSSAIAAAVAAGAATASGSKKGAKPTPKIAVKPKFSPKTEPADSPANSLADSSTAVGKKPKLPKTKPTTKKTANGKTTIARSKATAATTTTTTTTTRAVDAPISSFTPTTPITAVSAAPAVTAVTATTSKPPSQPIPKQTRTAGYHCKECQLDITSYADFRKHSRDIHTKSQNSFVCSVCQFKSDRKILHAYHQYVRHGIEPKTSSTSSSAQSPAPLLYNFPKCSICSFVAMTEPQMNRHRLKHYSLHVQCLHCKTFFTSEHNFAVHLQLEPHNSPMHKLYICSYCGKDFIDESNLQTHLKFLHKDDLVRDSLQYTDTVNTSN